MIVTLLAIAFLLLIGAVAFFGYKVVIRPSASPDQANTEKCTICQTRYNKEELILRQIGDYKLLYFCWNCVLGLYSETSVKK